MEMPLIFIYGFCVKNTCVGIFLVSSGYFDALLFFVRSQCCGIHSDRSRFMMTSLYSISFSVIISYCFSLTRSNIISTLLMTSGLRFLEKDVSPKS